MMGAIVASCMVILAGCNFLVSYHPILLPIEISVSSDGSIEISASPDIATPIGDFSVSVPLASFHIPNSESLLVIRRLVHVVEGVAVYDNASKPYVQLLRDETARNDEANSSATPITKDYLVIIKTARKLRFLVDGHFHLESPHSNIAILNTSEGVRGIRVDNVQGDSAAPRFSAAQVSTLPNPKLTTQPPPPASSPASTVTPTPTKTPTRTPVNVSNSPSSAATSSSPPPISSSELIPVRRSASRLPDFRPD